MILDQMPTLKINEIFHSIQGESSYAGAPTVFIRTSGCHLRCNYCDTTYAYQEGQQLELAQILETVKKFGSPYICVTGGEPLLQKQVLSLMTTLCDEGFFVSLETSGSLSCADVDSRVKLVIDVKTPDSGSAETFELENLSLKNRDIEWKFVLCSEKDLEWSENFCRQHVIFEKFMVLYSPSYRKIDPQWLAEKILQKKSPARLHLQLHKYIWSSETRGV